MKAERASRRNFLTRHVPNALDRPVLEIGAADNPTFWPHEGPVRYLDIFSTEELLAQYSRNPRRNPAHLVPVDYVLGTRRVDDVVSDRFGVLIANHVVEHVPDLLDWFGQVRRVSLDDGYLLLSVPDRRYTFDYLRRTTDVIDLLERHARRQTEPDVFTQLRGIYYYRPLRTDAAWQGTIDAAIARPRFTLREAAERIRRQADLASDVHSHVFTYSSFIELWHELEEAHLVAWRLVDAEDVVPGANEFHVLLAAKPGQPRSLGLTDRR